MLDCTTMDIITIGSLFCSSLARHLVFTYQDIHLLLLMENNLMQSLICVSVGWSFLPEKRQKNKCLMPRMEKKRNLFLLAVEVFQSYDNSLDAGGFV